MYKLNALENRFNKEKYCIDEKNIDETNLIKSIQFEKYTAFYYGLTLISIPNVIFIDFKFVSSMIISLYFVNICNNISNDYKKKYLEDNDINEQ